MTTDAGSLKEAGNEQFKGGHYKEALALYTQAIDTGNMKDLEKAVVFKNKAACYLKLGNNQKAIDEATQSLEFGPNDPKALFRRCQAYENLGRTDEAYRDAAFLMKVDPQNKAARPVFNRLNVIMQERIKQQNSTTHKVSQMFNITFDTAADKEKRIQGLNNLVVLSRDDVGANLVIKEGGLARLQSVLAEKDREIVQAGVRVLATLAKGSKERCIAILATVPVSAVLRLMSAETEEMASSVALLVQNLMSYRTGLEDHVVAVAKHEEEKKKDPSYKSRYPQLNMDAESKALLSEMFGGLVKMLVSGKVSAWGRDSAMELITKNVVSRKGADWTKKFLDETQGVENLLTVAGTQKEWKILPVSAQSSMHASLSLSKIWDDLANDKLRDKFKDRCHEHFRQLFSDEDFDSKIEAVAAISTLLQGPYEVGSMMMGLEGVVPLVLTLAESEVSKHQLVAVEAIVSTAQKKDKCSGILKDAVPVLKKLYGSSDDQVKVRALVGLCKLGSFGGTDASMQPMQDGSSEKLARICRKFLTQEGHSIDIRKWATEGLAYLTLNAEIKEQLVEDADAVKSIYSLSKEKERNVTYACVTVLVNCTNSYDKQEVPDEMVELAKYAKQHIPTLHDKDKPECISHRIQRLSKAGLINALVALSSTDSSNSRELLSRVYMSISTEESLRGLMVQQGAVKSLLSLQSDNTKVGETLAAHALAKIAVTQDPHIAFQGQRMYEVVRPLLSLLAPDCGGLQNFEALMGLTNLASVSDSLRNRILTEKGLSVIEHHMYEDHEMIRRAATECVCNMVMSEKVQELFEGENDRVKLLVLFVGEDDMKLVRAASGALAILSARPKICKKIVEVASWLDIYQVHTVSETPDIQFRAVHTVMNLVLAGEDTAKIVVDSPLLEILMAVSKDGDEAYKSSRQAASDALDHAIELGLIKANEKGRAPDQFLAILRAQLRKVAEEEAKRKKEEEEEEERQKQKEKEEKLKAAREFEENELAKDKEFEEETSGTKDETAQKVKELSRNLLSAAMGGPSIGQRRDEPDEEEEDKCEEIVVEAAQHDLGGPKIRELTEAEIEQIEAEEREKAEKKKNKKNSGKSVSFGATSDVAAGPSDEDEIARGMEDELSRGDIWNDESGIDNK